MTKWGPEYLSFLESFLSGELTAWEFVNRFFQINPTIEGQNPEEYSIYMDLFYAADAFNPEGLEIIGPSIGEVEMRRVAFDCLSKLKAIASKPTAAVANCSERIEG